MRAILLKTNGRPAPTSTKEIVPFAEDLSIPPKGFIARSRKQRSLMKRTRKNLPPRALFFAFGFAFALFFAFGPKQTKKSVVRGPAEEGMPAISLTQSVLYRSCLSATLIVQPVCMSLLAPETLAPQPQINSRSTLRESLLYVFSCSRKVLLALSAYLSFFSSMVDIMPTCLRGVSASVEAVFFKWVSG